MACGRWWNWPGATAATRCPFPPWRTRRGFHCRTWSGIALGHQTPAGLAHAPAEVTAGDVIRALEGTIVRVPCFEERPATPCGREGSCATRNVWLEVRRKLVETLDSITLADLVAGEAGGCCEEPAEGLRCAATVVAGSLSAGGPGTPEWGQSR